MANDAVLRALDALNERLVQAQAVGAALHAVGGENAPPWVYVYSDQVDAIQAASEALERVLRGDGGRAPHGDAALDQAGGSNAKDAARPAMAESVS